VAQHTPGPWSVHERPNYQGQPHLVGATIETDAVMIAEVRGATVIDGKRYEEHTANARLISASPELLEALSAMVAVYAMNNAEPVELRDALRHQVAGASAAIAKATAPCAASARLACSSGPEPGPGA